MSKHQTKSQRRASNLRHRQPRHHVEHRCTVCGASENAVWLIRHGISGEQCAPCGAKVESIMDAWLAQQKDALARGEPRSVLNAIDVEKWARIDALHATRGVES